MAEAAAVSTETLSPVVRARMGPDATVQDLRRLSGGASQELWAFDVDGAGGLRPLILRRNPGGFVKREGAPGMETEARLIALAGEAGAPVPKVAFVFEPEDGLGSGYVMERLEGETLGRKLVRDAEYAEARKVLPRQLGEALARTHAIDLAKAGDLRRTNVAESLENSYARYRALNMDRPVCEWAFRWLREHRPAEAPRLTVVHGDLRNGNIIVGPEGLRALLDWEAVHIGDPMEDLGWLCVTSWRFGEIDKPVGGFGPREELFAGYEAVSGQPVDAERVKFWEVMGTLRWGLTCAMMAREFQAGDRSVERAAIGRRTSETEIDLLAILAPPGDLRHA